MNLHRALSRRIRDDHARITRHVDALSRSLELPPRKDERQRLRDMLNLARAECHAMLATLDELGRWELQADLSEIGEAVEAEDAAKEECLAAFAAFAPKAESTAVVMLDEKGNYPPNMNAILGSVLSDGPAPAFRVLDSHARDHAPKEVKTTPPGFLGYDETKFEPEPCPDGKPGCAVLHLRPKSAPILGAPLFDHMNAAIAATTDQGETTRAGD